MKFEFSAGGIVFKHAGPQTKVLLACHGKYNEWIFPKGHIGDTIDGETKEQAAIREVKEETGIDAAIIAPLTPFEYWYTFKGEKRKKTVYFFAMEFLGGDMSTRDHEMEIVEWVQIQEVEEKLSHAAEKKVFQEAKKYFIDKQSTV